MTQISNILIDKNRPVLLASEISVETAVNIFKERRIRAAIISDDKKHIDGLLTERDIIYGLDKFGNRLLEKPVFAIMTKDVITCTVDAPLAGLTAQMYERNIRNIPVVSKTEILGIITMRDLIGVRLNQVQADADAMRDYISNGSR